MSDFNLAILIVLKNEGEFVDNPHDPGGATKFGISLRYLIQQKNKNMSIDDIRNLSQQDAINLYRIHWWDRYNYHAINNQIIANKILDMSVNMGSKQAHICLQRAILSSTGNHLDEDGILGDESFSAINQANPDTLLAALKSEAAGFYRSLRNSEFEKGWLTRAYS